MKKLVFVLIALFCFFLIACNEKQDNEKLESKSVDDKVNLESKQDLEETNQEQKVVTDGNTKDDEQNDNILTQLEVPNQDQEEVDDGNTKDDEQNDNILTQLEVNLEDLGDKIVEIKKDYLNNLISKGENNLTIDDIQIVELYGIFGDSVVFKVQRGAWEVFSTLTLGEYIFVFSNTNTPLVWNNGNIYELEEAFGANFFTDEDIMNLYNTFKRSID